MATYCFPLRPRYDIGLALALPVSAVSHNCCPVAASNARKRRSLVAPTKTSPPAVTVGPALPELPTSRLPSGSSSITPSGTDQRNAPVFASTATSSPHGGL